MPRHPEADLTAIKAAVGIVDLVRDYIPHLHPAGGSKYKALCPFHDDHNPSLELNPERQSYKCWSCGAGGDVFDFVQQIERIEFPEALRMLAERAGVDLKSADRSAPRGPSKDDLWKALAWAEAAFVDALAASDEARAYVASRGISAESTARFRLGFAPETRDWLTARARRAGFGMPVLEAAGLVARHPETGIWRERFRGRLIFPIRDGRGGTIAFGGRILPGTEKKWTEAGKGVAKYLNSPETVLFHKKKQLYAADLARAAARQAGWIAVVEGYTDVIAAHQAGLAQCVGTLGTALGDDHVEALRRMADRVVLVFDGDEAGQKAADRSLEFFLRHEVDVRVMTLPAGLDPADFLADEGADAFRALVDRAADPLEFAITRAQARFDFTSAEESRQAAEWVLTILARVPSSHRGGLDVKTAKALDMLARRLGVPIDELRRRLRQLRRPARPRQAEPAAAPAVSEPQKPIRPVDLDPIDRELVALALDQPAAVGALVTRVAPGSLRDAPLRTILATLFDLYGEGQVPAFDRVQSRLEDPAVKALAVALLEPIDEPQPLPDALVSGRSQPALADERLSKLLTKLSLRDWNHRNLELQAALSEAKADPGVGPDERRALERELIRHLSQRPDTRKASGSLA